MVSGLLLHFMGFFFMKSYTTFIVSRAIHCNIQKYIYMYYNTCSTYTCEHISCKIFKPFSGVAITYACTSI